jgi:twitching motility protein PilT
MLKEWVQLARDRGASDLHIESGTPLVLRIRGELIPLGGSIPPDALLQMTKDLLGASFWQDFLNRRSVDLSQTIAGTRCRINVFQTVRGMSLAIRLLYSFHNTLKDCNLHPDLRRLTKAQSGLVIISGPTGSGKSTTLAALIEEINSSERRNILSIESPIEYFFTNRQSFIRQREVFNHTPSYEQAIIDAMREDPDVLVISEMRTQDVMRLTLNAAETGHLVLATLHSSTCAEAISRICMSFPAEIQGSIRAQLADCLIGVVCQRLTYLPQYQIRVPQCEVLVANSAARSTIRSGQLSQILSAIQTGGEEGMWSFDRYQRWIEQKKDWAKPKAGEPKIDLPEERPLPPPRLKAPQEQKPALAKPILKPSPSLEKPQEVSGEGRIEISSEEGDLEELGRQLVEKYGSSDPDEKP